MLPFNDIKYRKIELPYNKALLEQITICFASKFIKELATYKILIPLSYISVIIIVAYVKGNQDISEHFNKKDLH
jgi:hypothetical protein